MPGARYRPVNVFTVIQSELLQGQGSCKDAASRSATNEVKQLMNAFPAAGLQLAQHAQRGQALHAPSIHAQDAHSPALDGGPPHSLAHLFILACMGHKKKKGGRRGWWT